MKTKEIYCVQETIGGWKQVPAFEATFDECQRYMEEWCHNGFFAIVPLDECEVDYL